MGQTATVHAVSRVRLRADPAAVRAVLADLSTWPEWLDVVTASQPEPGGRPPAWKTRLGFKVGPVELGTDVRLELVEDSPRHLRFERREDDGRDDHSVVVLDVTLDPDGEAVDVGLEVVVGKQIPFLDLQRELDRRRERTVVALQELVDRRGAPADGGS